MQLEDYVRLNQLYDLYGLLLTERQRNVLRLHVCEDLSLYEISQRLNISRQAVSDALNNARTRLEDYEQRLSLLSKSQSAHNIFLKLEEACKSSEYNSALINELLDELCNIFEPNKEE